MCVRTKTTWGCGCEFKNDAECHSRHCTGLERYHIPREGDCRSCKLGGGTVTRGREGKGRYAQELSRRSPTRGEDSFNSSSSIRSMSIKESVSGGASPWMVSNRREKNSPTREKADYAWEIEHVQRIEDLSQKVEEMTVASMPPAPRSTPRRNSPRHHRHDSPPSSSSSQDDEEEDPPNDDTSGDDNQRARHRPPPARLLYAEIRPPHRTNTYPTTSSPATARHASTRHESNDSLDSLPSQPPKLRTLPKSHSYKDPASSSRSPTSADPYDSGYISGPASLPRSQSYTYSVRPSGVQRLPPQHAKQQVYSTTAHGTNATRHHYSSAPPSPPQRGGGAGGFYEVPIPPQPTSYGYSNGGYGVEIFPRRY